jgi:hypothetical protein
MTAPPSPAPAPVEAAPDSPAPAAAAVDEAAAHAAEEEDADLMEALRLSKETFHAQVAIVLLMFQFAFHCHLPSRS